MLDASTLFGLSRRSLVTGLLATPTLAAIVEPSTAQTDGPRWSPQQAQAVLKDAKGAKLVLLNQYARTGIPFHVLKSIFITHHHVDHNIEYGPLLITATNDQRGR